VPVLGPTPEVRQGRLTGTVGGVSQDAAHRGQVPALLDGGGRQMHNRPDRGGTGRSGRRSATSPGPRRGALDPYVWIARQAADSTTSAGPGLAASSQQ
jgi:hypothetical protein